MEVLSEIKMDKARQYAELLLGSLTGTGKLHLEHLMMTKDFEYTSDYACRLRAEGAAAAEVREAARSILIVLKARGVPVTQHVQDRIRACTDTVQLEYWLERAVRIEHTDELFQE